MINMMLILIDRLFKNFNYINKSAQKNVTSDPLGSMMRITAYFILTGIKSNQLISFLCFGFS